MAQLWLLAGILVGPWVVAEPQIYNDQECWYIVFPVRNRWAQSQTVFSYHRLAAELAKVRAIQKFTTTPENQIIEAELTQKLQNRVDSCSLQLDGWLSNSGSQGHQVPRHLELTGDTKTPIRFDFWRVPKGDPTWNNSHECHCWVAMNLRLASTPLSHRSVGLDQADVPTDKQFYLVAQIQHQHETGLQRCALLGPITAKLRIGIQAFAFQLRPFERRLYDPELVLHASSQVAGDTSFTVAKRQLRSGLITPEIVAQAKTSKSLHVMTTESRYVRFSELRVVRPAGSVRLQFYYAVAKYTQNPVQLRLREYEDVTDSWKCLPDTDSNRQELPRRYRWTKFDQVIKLNPRTTTFCLEFNLPAADSEKDIDYGELWLDQLQIDLLDKHAEPGMVGWTRRHYYWWAALAAH